MNKVDRAISEIGKAIEEIDEVLEELRGLHGRVHDDVYSRQTVDRHFAVLDIDKASGWLSTICLLVEKLEAVNCASAISVEVPDPKPETPEAETARRSLKFARRFGLKIVSRDKDEPHSHIAGDIPGFNPRPADPLTVDVVLEVLAEKGLYGWTVGPTALVVGYAFVARKPSGAATYGDIPLLALLRALDAAGVINLPSPEATAGKGDKR